IDMLRNNMGYAANPLPAADGGSSKFKDTYTTLHEITPVRLLNCQAQLICDVWQAGRPQGSPLHLWRRKRASTGFPHFLNINICRFACREGCCFQCLVQV